jgi:hypothetical protein
MIKSQTLKKTIFAFFLLPFSFCVAVALGIIGQEQLALQAIAQSPHSDNPIAAVSQMPVRRLTVKVWGGMATYQTLEAEIRDDGNRVDFWLKIQPHPRAGDSSPTGHEYHGIIPTQTFEAFWNKLQTLNVEHLPDGFPGEQQANNSVGDREISGQSVIDAQSYTFSIQDRPQNFDHHFNVYGPEYLEDKRYQDVTVVFYELLKSVFGDRPFSQLTQS